MHVRLDVFRFSLLPGAKRVGSQKLGNTTLTHGLNVSEYLLIYFYLSYLFYRKLSANLY